MLFSLIASPTCGYTKCSELKNAKKKAEKLWRPLPRTLLPGKEKEWQLLIMLCKPGEAKTTPPFVLM